MVYASASKRRAYTGMRAASWRAALMVAHCGGRFAPPAVVGTPVPTILGGCCRSDSGYHHAHLPRF